MIGSLSDPFGGHGQRVGGGGYEGVGGCRGLFLPPREAWGVGGWVFDGGRYSAAAKTAARARKRARSHVDLGVNFEGPGNFEGQDGVLPQKIFDFRGPATHGGHGGREAGVGGCVAATPDRLEGGESGFAVTHPPFGRGLRRGQKASRSQCATPSRCI